MNRIAAGLVLFTLCVAHLAEAAETSKTGPETEKRFPPLKLPAGFQATLFACDPLVEYPSAVALGPRPGTLYLAIDYLTGLGTDIIRRDEIRLVEDTDGDGYADRTKVLADGFNSIQGMTFYDGVVYAVHSPLLTSLRDTDGDGVADERRDLLNGIGLPPEENPPRLHCGNGVVMGHDGWLYIAMGDHGCKITRPEGDQLVVEGGAILRCRADGRDAHVFSRGLRNIYDVTLDDELNVFVRDNENDGGDYKIRVCHSFFSADHGYPYLYYERPDEALAPLADLGLGSSAGGVCYLEHQFPPEYRGNLFFCEWGRAVMRYAPRRAGGGFSKIEELEFAAGAENDPYGFKPTDTIVDRDGSLIVVDWADGQRPRRGRARVYRIASDRASDPQKPGDPNGRENRKPPAESSPRPSIDEWIAQLDSPSYYVRIAAQIGLEHEGRNAATRISQGIRENRLSVPGKLHGIWVLAKTLGADAVNELFMIARVDPDSQVRAQAVRAIADLSDPVLVQHRLAAEPGDAGVAARLAELASSQDDQVILEVVIALGRLQWREAPAWIAMTLAAKKRDPAVQHASMQTLRSAKNWTAVLGMLDRTQSEDVRAVVVRAAARTCDASLVDGLIERLGSEQNQQRRNELADVLARAYRKPAPWVYWGYRPAARPANSVDWERSNVIAQALDTVLRDPDRAERLVILRLMQREQIPATLPRLIAWLTNERNPEYVSAILGSLYSLPPASSRGALAFVARDSTHSMLNRQLSVALLVRGMDADGEKVLLGLADSLEASPALADVLRSMAGLEIALRRDLLTGVAATSIPESVKFAPSPRLREESKSLLIGALRSPSPEVRIAAVEGVAELGIRDAEDVILNLLADSDAGVRRASAVAAGRMKLKSAADRLLELVHDPDPPVRRTSLDALRALGEPRTVPLALTALNDVESQVAALDCIIALGGPDQAEAVAGLAKRTPSASILPKTVRVLADWIGRQDTPTERRGDLNREVALIQGTSGVLMRWRSAEHANETNSDQIVQQASDVKESETTAGKNDAIEWKTVFAKDVDSRVTVPAVPDAAQGPFWIAATDVVVGAPTDVQFLGSASGPWRVWLNGRKIHDRTTSDSFQPDADRVVATLQSGLNRIVVQVTVNNKPGEFQLHYRPTSSNAERERLVQVSLARTGNADRGRKLVFDAEKSLCIKCHRVGEQGERVGPELTGVGSRFSRIHIVESILEPSRTIAPSFESMLVVMKDGRILNGIKTAETGTHMTIVDSKAEKLMVEKAEIEEVRAQPTSPMPDDLIKRFSTDEFVDLIAFLQSLKEPPPK